MIHVMRKHIEGQLSGFVVCNLYPNYLNLYLHLCVDYQSRARSEKSPGRAQVPNRKHKRAWVAQLVEHYSFNLRVQDSSPCSRVLHFGLFCNQRQSVAEQVVES